MCTNAQGLWRQMEQQLSAHKPMYCPSHPELSRLLFFFFFSVMKMLFFYLGLKLPKIRCCINQHLTMRFHFPTSLMDRSGSAPSINPKADCILAVPVNRTEL